MDFPERQTATRSWQRKRLRPLANRQLCTASLAAPGDLRLEPESCAVELCPVRHGVAERRHEYAGAMDDQARQRSIRGMEPRLAANRDGPACQHHSAERSDRDQAALDIASLTRGLAKIGCRDCSPSFLASTTAHLIQISRNATGEFGYDWMPINAAGAPLILATPRCVSVLSKTVVNCEAPVSVSVRVTS